MTPDIRMAKTKDKPARSPLSSNVNRFPCLPVTQGACHSYFLVGLCSVDGRSHDSQQIDALKWLAQERLLLLIR